MSVEKKIKAASGWGMLGVVLIAFIAIVAVFVLSIIGLVNADEAGVAASPLSGLGPGAQHHRLLPDLDSRIRLLHPAARAGARVHPLRRLQGHRA